MITARDADRFAELIPGSRKVVFEDTGHVPMLERPGAFNALLDEFLERIAVRPVRRAVAAGHGGPAPTRASPSAAARTIPKDHAASPQRAIAPCAALPTSFAYFWIAISTCSPLRSGGVYALRRCGDLGVGQRDVDVAADRRRS